MKVALYYVVVFGFLTLLTLRILFSLKRGLDNLRRFARDDVQSKGSRYHRVIVANASFWAVVASAVLVAVDFMSRSGAGIDQTFHVLFGGYLGFLVGLFFGVSTACAFAPKTFFQTKSARKWVKLIGADTTTEGRGVCIALAVLLAASYFGYMWFAVKDK